MWTYYTRQQVSQIDHVTLCSLSLSLSLSSLSLSLPSLSLDASTEYERLSYLAALSSSYYVCTLSR